MAYSYNELVAQIQAWANRYDDYFVAQIPNFINQGINRIYNEAKNIGFQLITNPLQMQTGSSFVQKPVNWKETISFMYVTGTTPASTYLLPRTYEFCTTYWPDPAVLAPPIFYADYSLNELNTASFFYISPTPDESYTYTLTYLGLPLFNEANPQNFLTDRFPDLLFYSCMAQAEPFLKDDERVPVFESYYNRALQGINRETVERYTDRTSRRDKD